MRPFALTYPQLVLQAEAHGIEAAGLGRIRQTYEFAEAMADGLYRPQGQPFINHLVRAASITLAEGEALPATLAAMAHSAYELHRFAGTRRRPADGQRRAEVAAKVGDDVEALIWAYHTTPWRFADLADYAGQVPGYDDLRRRVLVMRVANELEDLLDLAPRFSGAVRPSVEVLAGLARALGHDVLAQEVEEAGAACAAAALPTGVVRDRHLTYELPSRHLWESSRRDVVVRPVRSRLGLARRALRSALARRG
jgi:hypothetical protein